MFTQCSDGSLYESGKAIDDIKQANYLYGGEDYVLTDEDMKALYDGKIINFDVNYEYGCTLRYEPKGVI